MKCVAVGIVDAYGHPTHALSVCGPAARLNEPTLQTISASLLEIRDLTSGHGYSTSLAAYPSHTERATP